MADLIPRICKPIEESFFLFGPRGTGKTTWLKLKFPDALWVDLLEPDLFRTYSAKAERLSEVVRGSNKKVVVVDEVQRVPELLNVIHSLIEAKLGIQFILTGSSSRKLKRAGVDMLAGRAIKQTLHPFMAAEMGKNFNFDSALKYGLLPLVVSSPDPQKVLKTYAALYVREEVQMEGFVEVKGTAPFLYCLNWPARI